MSILNVWCSADRALIAVDTEVRFPDGTKVEAPKMYFLPLPNLVFAIRGQFITGQAIFNLFNQCNPATFDQAAAQLPEVIGHACAMLLEEARLGRIPYELQLASQVALVGWSDSARAFRAAVVDHPGTPEPTQPVQTNSVYMPWESDWGACPVRQASDVDLMLKLATHQLEHGARAHEDAGFGGRLIVAELNRSGTSFHNAGSIPVLNP